MNLTLEGISKTFQTAAGDLTVLKNINAQFVDGSSTAIIGRSGSGKSTLLSILAGLESASSGKMYLGDRDISHLSESEKIAFRRKDLGIIFQDFQLIDTLTVYDNLALPLELNGIEIGDKVEALLQRIGLNGKGKSFPHLLSGGEKQRVAFGRAIIHNPKIILADEPSGNLDDLTAKEVMPLLFNLVKDSKSCLVMVTHDEKIANQCDYKLVMAGGILSDC